MNDIFSILVQEKLLTDDAAAAAREQAGAGKPLDDVLHTADAVAQDKLLRFLAGFFDMPYAELETIEPPKPLLARFPARILLDHGLLPLEETPEGVVVATSRVFDSAGLDQLRLATGFELKPALASHSDIERAIKRVLGVGADTLQSMGVTDDSDVKVLDEMKEDDLDLTFDIGVVEPPPSSGRRVTHQRPDLRSQADKALDEVAADEAAGAGHENGPSRPARTGGHACLLRGCSKSASARS